MLHVHQTYFSIAVLFLLSFEISIYQNLILVICFSIGPMTEISGIIVLFYNYLSFGINLSVSVMKVTHPYLYRGNFN